MSRTIKGAKGPGYEYWTPRHGNNMSCPGSDTKTRTHRLERRKGVKRNQQEKVRYDKSWTTE